MIKYLPSNLACLLIAFLMCFMACENDSDDSSADLSLILTVDNSSPTFGDDVAISLSLTNAGPGTAMDVEASILLPSGLGLTASDAAPSTSFAASTGVWSVPVIANGETLELNLTATVEEDGEYDILAEISVSGSDDPNSIPGNNVSGEDDQQSIDLSPVPPSDVTVTTYAVVLGADGLAMDANGNLYAANYGQSTVYKVDTEKNVSTFLSNQPGAAGMALDNEGNLYLATYRTNQISRIALANNDTEAFASGIAAPIALEFDSEGNLWTNNNVNNAVTKIDREGNSSTITIDIYNNSSLTLDDNDNVYVSDYASGRIIKIDAATGEQTQFASLPLSSGGVGFIIYADGYFYATAIADAVVFMIDGDGQSEIIAGKQGETGNKDGDGNQARFERPIGIVAADDGRTLYVAQQGGAGAIRVITGFR